jgi:hypothetical protein
LALQEACVLVEVKQIDPNPEDIKAERMRAESGEPEVLSSIPGKRLRLKIAEGAKQLRARCNPNQAGLVVVYNNVSLHPVLTSEHNVLAAMYGKLGILLHVPASGPTTSEPRLGGNRSLNPSHNTVVSGVAILSYETERLELRVYHNDFARVPIEPELLRHERIRQYRSYHPEPGCLPGWSQIECRKS